MTEDDLRTLFASTSRNGRRPPDDARIEFDHDEKCTRIAAVWHGYGRDAYVRQGLQVSHVVAIRSEGDPPDRDPVEVAADLRAAVVSLAYACIDATAYAPEPSYRPNTRPFRPFRAAS